MVWPFFVLTGAENHMVSFCRTGLDFFDLDGDLLDTQAVQAINHAHGWRSLPTLVTILDVQQH